MTGRHSMKEPSMTLPNMTTEPVRLPAWVVSAVTVVVLPAATALLEGRAWKSVLIATVAAVSVLLGGAETARAFVTAPAHRANATTSELPSPRDVDMAKLAAQIDTPTPEPPPLGNPPEPQWTDTPATAATPATLGAPDGKTLIPELHDPPPPHPDGLMTTGPNGKLSGPGVTP